MFRGCSKCNKGYIYRTDSNNEVYIIKCDCLIEYQKNKNLIYELEESNISKEYINLDVNSYKGNKSKNNLELIQFFIENFKKEFMNYNMFFTGVQGTQKTTLSKYIALELLKQDLSCYYILADDLIKSLLQADRDLEIKDRLEKILKKDFLIIDELSDDKCTIYQSEYQIPFFTSFLKTRLETIKKSTLFISNYNIEQLYESKFGKTIADLINRECKEKLLFEDNYFALNKNEIKTIADRIKERINGKQ